jgi:hypothetical protein
MRLIRKRATAVLGVIALTAAAAPAAHAQVVPTWGVGAGFPAAAGVGASPCATTVTGLVGGSPGTPLISSCSGVSYIGPTIGQMATTTGPVNTGPVVVGQQVVSAGPVVLGY